MSEGEVTWNQTFLKIADAYMNDFFKSDTDEYLKIIAASDIRLGVLCEAYSILKKQSKIIPLENLSPEEKAELWNEANRLSPIKTKEYLHRVCKAIYFFGQYIQL